MAKVPFHIQRASLIDNVGTPRMDPEPSLLDSRWRRLSPDPRDETGNTTLFGAKQPWIIAVLNLSDKGSDLPCSEAEVDASLIDDLKAMFGAVHSLKLTLTPSRDALITPSLSEINTVNQYLKNEPSLLWEVSGECAITLCHTDNDELQNLVLPQLSFQAS